MPTFTWKDRIVHYLDVGSGEPVVLLHPAAPAASEQWRKLFPHLESQYRLLAPDLWGFGQTASWSADAPLIHDDHADLVQALIRRSSDGPTHLVGHSYGGATAVRVALLAPTLVRSLTVIEPLLADRYFKRLFRPATPAVCLRWRPRLARGDGGAPSPPRQPAAAARSNA